MSVYRGQFNRLLELDKRIRGGAYPNCTSFAKKWEVSRKTIQRDIEFLRDSQRAPIKYDHARRGYHYTDPSWSMPAINLTEGELLQLLLAERMARQLRGTPLADRLESLFDKIRAVLPDEVTVDPEYFRTQFSFQGQPARPVNEQVWLALFRALRAGRVLQITYKNPDRSRPQTRAVEPVHLTSIDGEWYLVGHCRWREGLRQFAVSRIQSAKMTDKRFEPHPFDPKEFFAERFGRFVGKPGESHEVVIRFAKTAAPWVLERTWHPKQKIEKHRDGRLTLSFPAPSLFEVKRWVLAWGAEAEVLKPKELRIELKRETGKMRRVYS